MISNPALLSLSDIASQAHEKIQQDFEYINPVISIMQGMRNTGIPADVMAIDCLTSNKRIIIVLHDDFPNLIRYQFTFSDQDPIDDYQQAAASDVTSETIYGWIKDYFTVLK